MELMRETADTLKRYFLNADPFLWGVLAASRKSERILELQGMGFLAGYPENTKQTYDALNRQLLVELGIEGILSRIVVPIVYKRLGSDNLNRFRRLWEEGRKPDFKYLKDRKLFKIHHIRLSQRWEEHHEVPEKDPALIFVDINQQLNFVDHWTVFAGLWFETIDPLLSSEERAKYEKMLQSKSKS
jgi:hypothetical protein